MTPRITAVHSIEDVAGVWPELERSTTNDFFLSWSWMREWLAVVLPATPVWLFSCHRAETSGPPVGLGLLTLGAERRLRSFLAIRQLRLNEYRTEGWDLQMPYNGLLAVPGLEESVWESFLAAVQAWDQPWDEVAISSLSDGDLERLTKSDPGLRLRHEKTFRRWRLKLTPADTDRKTLISRFKKKSRQQLRQSLRAFAELGDLKVQVASSATEALTMFNQLESLHTPRWHAAGEGGAFANEHWVDLHRGLIENAFDFGAVRCMEVLCDGQCMGVLYGHVYRDTVYMQQTGFVRTDDNALRPGYVSHLEAMRHFAGEGLSTYDFLPDRRDSYKRFFTEAGPEVHWIDLQRPCVKLRLEAAIRKATGH